MKAIKKYLLLVFLIENIMVQSELLGAYTNIVFFASLALSFFGIIDGTIFKAVNVKKFWWTYVLIAIYCIYEFLIAPEFISSKTLTYLLAKIATLIIIITSVSNSREFYNNKVIIILISTMAFFLAYGLITGVGVRTNEWTGEFRDRAGFTNPNTAGSMGAIIVGMLIYYVKDKKWNFFYIILLLIGFYGVLAGASRAGFLMLGLFVLFRYGISIKSVLMAGLLLFTAFFLLDAIGVKTFGIQRMVMTYDGEIGTLRDNEREAAELMIAQSPYIGWGYEPENSNEADSISTLESHNAYLEVTKQMGIPTAILFFIIILIPILRNLILSYNYKIRFSLFLVLCLILLVKANYEALIVGVHEFETNLFFFSLAMVSSQNYNIKRELKNFI